MKMENEVTNAPMIQASADDLLVAVKNEDSQYTKAELEDEIVVSLGSESAGKGPTEGSAKSSSPHPIVTASTQLRSSDESFRNQDLRIVSEECGKMQLKENNSTHAIRDSFCSEMPIGEHSDPNLVTCDFCGKSFPGKHELKNHIVKHLARKPHYFCDSCGTKFNRKADLKVHLFCHNSDFIETNESGTAVLIKMCGLDKRTSNLFFCCICDAKFAYRSNLEKHFLTHTSPIMFCCHVCGKIFSDKLKLIDHKMTHAPFLCGICGERFEKKIRIKRHIESHLTDRVMQAQYPSDPSKAALHSDDKAALHSDDKANTCQTPYVCGFCGQGFEMLSFLTDHKRSAHYFKCQKIPNQHSSNEKEKTCDFCGKMFLNESGLENHRCILKFYKSLRCNDCGRIFDSKTALKRHVLIHNDEIRNKEVIFPCEICGIKFLDSYELRKHKYFLHKTYRCEPCGKEFKESADFKQHSLSHKINGALVCRTCGQRFACYRTLTKHERESHLLSCEVCGRKFLLKDHLVQHELSHHQSSVCITCGKIFKTKQSLGKHELSCKNQSQFICSTCGKIFKRKSCLQVHELVHKPPKFICNTCGKLWKRKTDLMRHIMLIHSPQFICSTCGKTFIRKKNLEHHVLSHNYESQFICSTCGKIFIREKNLERHVLSHNHESQLICSTCGKIFKTKVYLRLHEVFHKPPKFICNTCGKLWKRKGDLIRHMLIHRRQSQIICTTSGKFFLWKGFLGHSTQPGHSILKPIGDDIIFGKSSRQLNGTMQTFTPRDISTDSVNDEMTSPCDFTDSGEFPTPTISIKDELTFTDEKPMKSGAFNLVKRDASEDAKSHELITSCADSGGFSSQNIYVKNELTSTEKKPMRTSGLVARDTRDVTESSFRSSPCEKSSTVGTDAVKVNIIPYDITGDNSTRIPFSALLNLVDIIENSFISTSSVNTDLMTPEFIPTMKYSSNNTEKIPFQVRSDLKDDKNLAIYGTCSDDPPVNTDLIKLEFRPADEKFVPGRTIEDSSKPVPFSHQHNYLMDVVKNSTNYSVSEDSSSVNTDLVKLEFTSTDEKPFPNSITQDSSELVPFSHQHNLMDAVENTVNYSVSAGSSTVNTDLVKTEYIPTTEKTFPYNIPGDNSKFIPVTRRHDYLDAENSSNDTTPTDAIIVNTGLVKSEFIPTVKKSFPCNNSRLSQRNLTNTVGNPSNTELSKSGLISKAEKPRYSAQTSCSQTVDRDVKLNCFPVVRLEKILPVHVLIERGVIHPGYTCEVCGKWFTHKDWSLEHALSHTDEKPLPCAISTNHVGGGEKAFSSGRKRARKVSLPLAGASNTSKVIFHSAKRKKTSLSSFSLL